MLVFVWGSPMPTGNKPIQSVAGEGTQTPSSSAGIMALIADVEKQLASLREADEQRRIADEALAARESAALAMEQRALEAAQSNEAEAERLRLQHETLDAERESLATAGAEIASAKKELESQRAELERELDRIAALEQETQNARHTAAELQAEAERLAAEAELAMAQAQTAAKEADQRRSQMERTLAERTAAFRAAEERMEQRASDTSSMISEAQATAERHASKIASLESELASTRSDVVRLTTDLQEKSQVIASRNEELKSLRSQVATLRDKSGADSALKTQLAELQQTQTRSLEELEQLRSRLNEAQAKSDEYLRHIAEIEGQLVESQRALVTASSNASAAANDSELQARLQEATAERDLALEEAEKLRDFARTLGQELAAARAHQPGTLANPSDESTAARRDRLRRQRKLLREQSEKVRRASDAVRDRFEQVEQILSQRAELLAAKKSIDESKRKLRGRQARNGALSAIFYFSMALLIYSGIGWIVAQKIAPAVYAVTAQVQADASGRPLSQAELDEWQRYHEDLITDPRFLDVASDRLKQRGVASLSTPTALKDRLDADLTLISDRSGSLTIELRGLGAERTKRELDTITTTFVRTANSARERRVDGSNTIIVSESTVSDAPLYDERVYYAAAIAAGLTLLSIIAAYGLWRKLYEAKASLERTDEFEGLIDETRWTLPKRTT